MRKPVVVFDLDGTLTRADTSLPFLSQVAGRGRVWKFAAASALWAPIDAVRAVRVERRRRGVGRLGGMVMGYQHQRIAGRVLRGMPREDVASAGAAFAERVLEGGLRGDAREMLARHAKGSERLILASASVDAYVEPLAETLGFEAFVATRLEYSGDVATGRFEGPICWGTEKLRRLREVIGADTPISVAYGNGPGDAPVLESAERAVLVR